MPGTLNGMFTVEKPYKKDFIKENRKKLRQSSAVLARKKEDEESVSSHQPMKARSASVSRISFRSEKQKKSSCTGCKIETRGDLAVFVHNKVRSSTSDKSSKSSKDSINTSSTSPKVPKNKKHFTVKHQSSQTIDPNKLDELYFIGTIKYPSPHIAQKIEERKQKRLDSFIKDAVIEKAQKDENKLAKIILPDIKTPRKIKELENTDIEKIKPPSKSPHQLPQNLNAADIIRKTTEEHGGLSSKRSITSNKSDTLPSSYIRGEIPKYLKERQKKLEDERSKREEIDEDCPPGHVPLPEEERLKTLDMLKNSYAQAIKELNTLPVRSDTLRVRAMKTELEKKLNKLEEGMKIFNKSRVYVKVT